MSKYRPTIGIECHVQLKTVSKLFSGAGNDARQAPPNSLVTHIDFGLPGALPVLNEAAVRLAAYAALALKTKPQAFSYFERKHYFYPDLPMGYQISQLSHPIIVGGEVEIKVDGKTQTVKLNRAQLEADAGKNTHPSGQDYSLVDLNRAGTPLLEIVSEPDMHSPAEAKAYVRELYLLMLYAEVSDCDLYYGNMRFDVNVSVSNSDELGTRTETKNLNSFRAVEKTVEYEIKRQIELLEQRQPVIQETRGWDEAKQRTVSQRGKEEAHDYRYMPDPDLPPVVIDADYIKQVEDNMPKLPKQIREELSALGMGDKVIEEILDNPDVYAKVNQSAKAQASAEALRRIAYDSLENPKTLSIKVQDHVKIADSFNRSVLSSSGATQALADLASQPNRGVEEIIGLNKQQSDEGQLSEIVKEVLAANPKAADDVSSGETKAIGFLVGQVMKGSQGKANPQLAETIIKQQLKVN